MTIAALITEGIGPGSAIKFVLTEGLDIGAAIAKAGQTGKRQRREIVLANGVRIVTNTERIHWEHVPESVEARAIVPTKAKAPRRRKTPVQIEPTAQAPETAAQVRAPEPLVPIPPPLTVAHVAKLFEQKTQRQARKLAEQICQAQLAAEEQARQAELDDEEALLHIVLAAA